MENMKRALSAFMALVLVLGMLPGVPMFAGAEEVETQPETVAVETTEAATTVDFLQNRTRFLRGNTTYVFLPHGPIRHPAPIPVPS